MYRRLLTSVMAVVIALCLSSTNAAAASSSDDQLVVDISQRLVAITAGFAGAKLLLFGTAPTDAEVVVVVHGRAGSQTVRRKERVGGIWANTDAVEFAHVPAYYAIASSRPLSEITSRAEFAQLRIGVDWIDLGPLDINDQEAVKPFRQALVRLMQKRGLFSSEVGQVVHLGTQLFRTTVQFPSNVPTGTYSASVYLFRDGVLVAQTQTPLAVRKVGIESLVYEFAYRQPFVYGVVAVTIALFSGWLAGALFRKS